VERPERERRENHRDPVTTSHLPGGERGSVPAADEPSPARARAARELLDASGVALSAAGAALLHQRTEEWAAGLRLAALSLAGHPDPERFVAEFSGSDRTVAEYLIDEMLERQPPDVQDLLLRASLLDQVNGELADVLTGRPGSERILLELEDANAFVVSLGTQPVIAPALMTLAGTMVWLGEFDEGERWLRRTAQALQTDSGPDVRVLLRQTAGILHAGRGRHRETLEEFSAAERLTSQLAGLQAMASQVTGWLLGTQARLGMPGEPARRSPRSMTSGPAPARSVMPARRSASRTLMDSAPARYMVRINAHLGATVLSAFPRTGKGSEPGGRGFRQCCLAATGTLLPARRRPGAGPPHRRPAGCRLNQDALSALPDDELMTELTAISGTGPWTVQGALLIALRREDVVLPDDLALRESIQSAYRLDHLPSQQEVLAIAEKWRPYRGLTASYLFSAAFEPAGASPVARDGSP
jgi:hypothetical protein